MTGVRPPESFLPQEARAQRDSTAQSVRHKSFLVSFFIFKGSLSRKICFMLSYGTERKRVWISEDFVNVLPFQRHYDRIKPYRICLINRYGDEEYDLS